MGAHRTEPNTLPAITASGELSSPLSSPPLPFYYLSTYPSSIHLFVILFTSRPYLAVSPPSTTTTLAFSECPRQTNTLSRSGLNL